MKKRHAKNPGKKTIDSNLLGPCGCYCGYCLAYRIGECLGCRYQAYKNIELGRPVFCSTLVCAEQNGLEMCSECEEFPCDEEFDPKKNIFSAVYIDYIKNDIKPIAQSKATMIRKRR